VGVALPRGVRHQDQLTHRQLELSRCQELISE
jgi:hypothetical protein